MSLYVAFFWYLFIYLFIYLFETGSHCVALFGLDTESQRFTCLQLPSRGIKSMYYHIWVYMVTSVLFVCLVLIMGKPLFAKYLWHAQVGIHIEFETYRYNSTWESCYFLSFFIFTNFLTSLCYTFVSEIAQNVCMLWEDIVTHFYS